MIPKNWALLREDPLDLYQKWHQHSQFSLAFYSITLKNDGPLSWHYVLLSKSSESYVKWLQRYNMGKFFGLLKPFDIWCERLLSYNVCSTIWPEISHSRNFTLDQQHPLACTNRLNSKNFSIPQCHTIFQDLAVSLYYILTYLLLKKKKKKKNQPWPFFELVENEKKLANLPSPKEVEMQILRTIFF